MIGWVTPDSSGVVGYGASGNATRPLVDGDTVFQIGSITKTFTALVLAEMAERGEVRLDEPISALLPGATWGSERVANASLAALASHHTGLPRLAVGPRLFLAVLFHRGNPYRGMDEASVWSDVTGLDDGDLGDGFAYSNLGVAVLGLGLAERAGVPYPELVGARVLGPLGMTGATFDPTRAGHHLAHGHSVNLRPTPSWTFDGYAPAGGLLASGDAMLRFLAANLDGTAPGAALAHTPRARIDEEDSVGLGWMITEREGRTVMWHNGGTGGFRSFLGFDPERDIGVFVLANSDNSVDRVGGWLLGQSAAPSAPRPERVTGAALAAVIAFSVGRVALVGGGPIASLAVWRRKLVGASRTEAVGGLVAALTLLGFLADTLDWRGYPRGTFGIGATLALALNAWVVARLWRAPQAPAAGWSERVARVGNVLITAVMLWAAFGSPRVG